MQSLCVEMNTTGTYNVYDPQGNLFTQDGHRGIANSGTTTVGKGGEAPEESVPDGLWDL